MALQVPIRIYLNTQSTQIIVKANNGIDYSKNLARGVFVPQPIATDRIQLFQGDSIGYIWSDILDGAGAPYGIDRDTTLEALTNLGGFNLGGGGGSVNSVTASLPLTSSGGANPNITLQNPGDGNWALNFLGGAATFIPIQGETVGSYKSFAHTTIPANYLFCNGAIVLIATYPDLFAVIGNDYGGDGITTFGIPDLQGRFLQGDNGSNIGTESGANTLNASQLPTVNASGTIQVSTSDGNITAANGSYFANVTDVNATFLTGFLPNGSQGTTVNVAGVQLNSFGANIPHEHPHLVARIAICFESVGVSGASPTPSFNAVLGVSNNSNIKAQFNGVNYATVNDIISGVGLEQTHTTGATVTIADNTDILYVNPGALLPTLTITMPPNPINKQEVKVSFGGTITVGTVITALTILPNVGHTILGTTTSPVNAGDGYVFKFQQSLNLWRRF